MDNERATAMVASIAIFNNLIYNFSYEKEI